MDTILLPQTLVPSKYSSGFHGFNGSPNTGVSNLNACRGQVVSYKRVRWSGYKRLWKMNQFNLNLQLIIAIIGIVVSFSVFKRSWKYGLGAKFLNFKIFCGSSQSVFYLWPVCLLYFNVLPVHSQRFP